MNKDYDATEMFEAYPSKEEPLFSWDWTAFLTLGALALIFTGLLIKIIQYGA